MVCVSIAASVSLGYEAILRAEGGDSENQVIITDPSQGALRDGWVNNWKVHLCSIIDTEYKKQELI